MLTPPHGQLRSNANRSERRRAQKLSHHRGRCPAVTSCKTLLWNFGQSKKRWQQGIPITVEPRSSAVLSTQVGHSAEPMSSMSGYNPASKPTLLVSRAYLSYFYLQSAPASGSSSLRTSAAKPRCKCISSAVPASRHCRALIASMSQRCKAIGLLQHRLQPDEGGDPQNPLEEKTSSVLPDCSECRSKNCQCRLITMTS